MKNHAFLCVILQFLLFFCFFLYLPLSCLFLSNYLGISGYINQRFGSGSGSGSGSGGSGTFWVEAEAEAIFENHLEAEAEAEAPFKKKMEAEAEAI